MSSSEGRGNHDADVVRYKSRIKDSRLGQNSVQVFGVVLERKLGFRIYWLRPGDASLIVDQTPIVLLERCDNRPPAFARHRPSADEHKRVTFTGDFKVQRSTRSV